MTSVRGAPMWTLRPTWRDWQSRETPRVPAASTSVHGSRNASPGRKRSLYLKITIWHGTVETECWLTLVGAGFFPQPGCGKVALRQAGAGQQQQQTSTHQQGQRPFSASYWGGLSRHWMKGACYTGIGICMYPEFPQVE